MAEINMRLTVDILPIAKESWPKIKRFGKV